MKKYEGKRWRPANQFIHPELDLVRSFDSWLWSLKIKNNLLKPQFLKSASFDLNWASMIS